MGRKRRSFLNAKMIWSSDGSIVLLVSLILFLFSNDVTGSPMPNDTNMDLGVQKFKCDFNLVGTTTFNSTVRDELSRSYRTLTEKWDHILTGERDSPFILAQNFEFSSTSNQVQVELVADRLPYESRYMNESDVEAILDKRLELSTMGGDPNSYTVGNCTRDTEDVQLSSTFTLHSLYDVAHELYTTRLNIRIDVPSLQYQTILSDRTSAEFNKAAQVWRIGFCAFDYNQDPANPMKPHCHTEKFSSSQGKLVVYLSIGWSAIESDPQGHFMDFLNGTLVENGTLEIGLISFPFSAISVLQVDYTFRGFMDLVAREKASIKIERMTPATEVLKDPIIIKTYGAILNRQSNFGKNYADEYDTFQKIDVATSTMDRCGKTTGADKYHIMFRFKPKLQPDYRKSQTYPFSNLAHPQSVAYKGLMIELMDDAISFAKFMHGNDSWGDACVNGFHTISSTLAHTNITILIKPRITASLDMENVIANFSKFIHDLRTVVIDDSSVDGQLDPFSMKIKRYVYTTKELNDLEIDERINVVFKVENVNYTSAFSQTGSKEYRQLKNDINQEILITLQSMAEIETGRLNGVYTAQDGSLMVSLSFLQDHNQVKSVKIVRDQVKDLAQLDRFGKFKVDVNTVFATEDDSMQGFMGLLLQLDMENQTHYAYSHRTEVIDNDIFRVYEEYMNKAHPRGRYLKSIIGAFAKYDKAIAASKSCDPNRQTGTYDLEFRARPVRLSTFNMGNILNKNSFAQRYFIARIHPELKKALKENVHGDQMDKVCIHNIDGYLPGDATVRVEASVEFKPGWTQTYYKEDIEEGILDGVTESLILSFLVNPSKSIKTDLDSRGNDKTNFSYKYLVTIALPIFGVVTFLIIMLMCATKTYKTRKASKASQST